MKKLTIFGIIACSGLLSAPAAVIGAGPPKVKVNVSTVYQFTGYAGETTGNAGGIDGMHAICQAAFGDQARMCTTKEFWTSPGAVPPDSLQAWVHPSVVGMFQNDSGSGIDNYALDFSGRQLPLSSGIVLPTCDQWSTAVGLGTVIFPGDASVQLAQCDSIVPLEVTCCVPANQ